MQSADLLLGVLTEFPESPDGCHSDRLRGAKSGAAAEEEEEEEQGTRTRTRTGTREAFKQAPPLRARIA